jgi:catechol 2,3-dioxygenase-like lactoylglutathione lyase family enzyme
MRPLSQPKEMSGGWVDKGTNIKNARVKSLHLKFPGSDKDAPTLEISEYNQSEEKQTSIPNRLGFGHIAFLVDDVEAIRQRVVDCGGKDLGETSKHEFPNVGILTFVYMKDLKKTS